MKYQLKLKDNIKLYLGNTTPASNEEIAKVEKDLKVSLPFAIKEFFLLVGNDYNYLWENVGADKLINANYNKDLAIMLLNDCNVILSRPYFVFSSYGDQFMFVYLDEGDDPVVYRFEIQLYHLGDDYLPDSSTWNYPKGVSKIADSFSSLINSIVEYKLKN